MPESSWPKVFKWTGIVCAVVFVVILLIASIALYDNRPTYVDVVNVAYRRNCPQPTDVRPVVDVNYGSEKLSLFTGRVTYDQMNQICRSLNLKESPVSNALVIKSREDDQRVDAAVRSYKEAIFPNSTDKDWLFWTGYSYDLTAGSNVLDKLENYQLPANDQGNPLEYLQANPFCAKFGDWRPLFEQLRKYGPTGRVYILKDFRGDRMSGKTPSCWLLIHSAELDELGFNCRQLGELPLLPFMCQSDDSRTKAGKYADLSSALRRPPSEKGNTPVTLCSTSVPTLLKQVRFPNTGWTANFYTGRATFAKMKDICLQTNTKGHNAANLLRMNNRVEEEFFNKQVMADRYAFFNTTFSEQWLVWTDFSYDLSVSRNWVQLEHNELPSNAYANFCPDEPDRADQMRLFKEKYGQQGTVHIVKDYRDLAEKVDGIKIDREAWRGCWRLFHEHQLQELGIGCPYENDRSRPPTLSFACTFEISKSVALCSDNVQLLRKASFNDDQHSLDLYGGLANYTTMVRTCGGTENLLYIKDNETEVQVNNAVGSIRKKFYDSYINIPNESNAGLIWTGYSYNMDDEYDRKMLIDNPNGINKYNNFCDPRWSNNRAERVADLEKRIGRKVMLRLVKDFGNDQGTQNPGCWHIFTDAYLKELGYSCDSDYPRLPFICLPRVKCVPPDPVNHKPITSVKFKGSDWDMSLYPFLYDYASMQKHCGGKANLLYLNSAPEEAQVDEVVNGLKSQFFQPVNSSRPSSFLMWTGWRYDLQNTADWTNLINDNFPLNGNVNTGHKNFCQDLDTQAKRNTKINSFTNNFGRRGYVHIMKNYHSNARPKQGCWTLIHEKEIDRMGTACPVAPFICTYEVSKSVEPCSNNNRLLKPASFDDDQHSLDLYGGVVNYATMVKTCGGTENLLYIKDKETEVQVNNAVGSIRTKFFDNYINIPIESNRGLIWTGYSYNMDDEYDRKRLIDNPNGINKYNNFCDPRWSNNRAERVADLEKRTGRKVMLRLVKDFGKEQATSNPGCWHIFTDAYLKELGYGCDSDYPRLPFICLPRVKCVPPDPVNHTPITSVQFKGSDWDMSLYPFLYDFNSMQNHCGGKRNLLYLNSAPEEAQVDEVVNGLKSQFFQSATSTRPSSFLMWTGWRYDLQNTADWTNLENDNFPLNGNVNTGHKNFCQDLDTQAKRYTKISSFTNNFGRRGYVQIMKNYHSNARPKQGCWTLIHEKEIDRMGTACPVAPFICTYEVSKSVEPCSNNNRLLRKAPFGDNQHSLDLYGGTANYANMVKTCGGTENLLYIKDKETEVQVNNAIGGFRTKFFDNYINIPIESNRGLIWTGYSYNMDDEYDRKRLIDNPNGVNKYNNFCDPRWSNNRAERVADLEKRTGRKVMLRLVKDFGKEQATSNPGCWHIYTDAYLKELGYSCDSDYPRLPFICLPRVSK